MAQPTHTVDSHQHVFWHGRDDRGLVQDMDEHGIATAWLLTWEVPPWEDNPAYHAVLNPLNMRADGTHAGIPLRDLLITRERYPDRFLVGYCPHPAVGDAPGLLRAAVQMHDVKVCAEWKFRLPFDDPRCLELFHVAGALQLPVVLHLDVPYLRDAEGKLAYQNQWYGGTVANLERALQACPETTFIGHAPGFWREISADADDDPEPYPRGPVQPTGRLYDLFDRYPNLYADLSAGSGRYALERDPAHALQFLQRYSDRLLFGRDYYGQDLHNFLQTLDLPAAVVEKIYHGNAEKLLNPA
ncbi:MAG TPA: amidohydrolase family protein [Abditibacteriaceae bacterium]|nr:amidohydrolase family protein [Abditibacteriaceae bacterium]